MFIFLLGCNCPEETKQNPDSVLWKEIIAMFRYSWVESPYFPSCLCCLSLDVLTAASAFLHGLIGKNWHHTTSVFHHGYGCIYFSPLSEPSTTDVLPMTNFPFVSTVHAWISPELSVWRNWSCNLWAEASLFSTAKCELEPKTALSVHKWFFFLLLIINSVVISVNAEMLLISIIFFKDSCEFCISLASWAKWDGYFKLYLAVV